MEPEQINQEIKTLKEMKPKVRRKTSFGDDNHEAIEAQIMVLEMGYDESIVYDAWGDDDYVLYLAMQAIDWRDHGGDLPSEGWQSLVEE